MPHIARSCNGLLLIVFEDDDYRNLSFYGIYAQYYNLVFIYDLEDKCDTFFGFCYDTCTVDYEVLVGFSASVYDYESVFVSNFKTEHWIEIEKSL